MKSLSINMNDAYSSEYSELLIKIDNLQTDAKQCLQHIDSEDAKMAYDLIQYEIERLTERCEGIRKIPT